MAVKRSRARTEEVSSAMQNFTRSFFVDKLGVDVIYGSARLGPNHTVIVTSREVSETELVFTAEKILIATGSLPFHPANIPFDDPDIFDSEGLPKHKRVSKSALVVGGGTLTGTIDQIGQDIKAIKDLRFEQIIFAFMGLELDKVIETAKELSRFAR